ncbi:MAG: type I restriction enzyme HsdR N-terminal domain-containing protein [Gammaproteobacteria bacterium]|nr:type I restriction enzyme HsdR N-terminal domain-containing protein [Gammaproteobacteria bacterium]
MTDLLPRLEAYALERADYPALCDTEEQTKITLINPYLEVLGFDVRNPKAVRLEFSTGVGKIAERVDYAIIRDGNPVILIEAKSATASTESSAHLHQIRRYAQDAPTVRFAALTNGVKWRWYHKSGDGRLSDEPFMICDTFCAEGHRRQVPRDRQRRSNIV